jgi:hypothetical protein
MYFKHDPGPCPVDQAPHTTCCAPESDATILVVQLPGRDGYVPPPLVGAMNTPAPPAGAVMPPLLRGEQIQATLPPGQVTTATYRRKGRKG